MSGVLAVIPARGGSKGVPGKNTAPVGGVPLVARAVRAARAARRIDQVAVSTDADDIAAAAGLAGAVIVRRPDALAGDTASSESALLHAVDALRREGDPEIVVMVQATSPFITAAELDDLVAAIEAGADSAFTAAPFHGFVWRTAADATGVNHDPAGRPRRQDREPEWLETGAAYAMRTAGFRVAGHRFFGRIVAVPTDPARVLEIDEPADLSRARALAHLLDADVRPGPGEVDAVVLDFDGTQTDDRAWVAADGTERVAVHRGDGMGVAAMRRAGLPVLILSTEVNPVVSARAAKLGVECRHGIEDKGGELGSWLAEHRLEPRRVLYLGNDINDLPCFEQVGWPVAVASARPSVRAAARACHHPARRAGCRPRDRLVDPRRGTAMTAINRRLRKIGDRLVGPGQPVYVIGEIGINHNGDLANAIALIDAARTAGMDAVKFQKRTPEVCTPRDQWEIERDTPVGPDDLHRLPAPRRVRRGRVRRHRRPLPRGRHRLVRLAVGRRERPVPLPLRHPGLQGGLREPHRRRTAAGNAGHRQDGHPVQRDVDPPTRSGTPSRCSAVPTSCCCTPPAPTRLRPTS